MGILLKLLQKRVSLSSSPGTAREKGGSPSVIYKSHRPKVKTDQETNRKNLMSGVYLYDEEERNLLRDINLSLIIIKMAFQLAEDRRLATGIMAKNLQPFVVLDLDKTRKFYLQQLAKVARAESAQFTAKNNFISFEELGKLWQRSGRDLYDHSTSLGPMGEQLENKLQHVLRKYARKENAPYLTLVTRLPAEPLRVEVPRFQVVRPFVIGGIPCASFEDARALAQVLAPAVARDEKDGLIEPYTSYYFD
ncbi:hypothetical protein F9B85_00440 [Heliorestis acidaminivorans]|uniref:Uncharacterized protein n=1 Tax=Heliorestis acidaminivorans TaxID=553427 RepID=A0A6I0ETT4_9FIRM|nr:hypothetical protein [Heliorestis acidaminivorans]KAB2954205.1 hypothetical protein F9B85_00440 [Heliorestis acidaminivorans]